MITAYLLRAIVVGGLIGLAASLIEFAFAAGRRPRRFVWLVALALSTVVPAVGVVGFDRAEDSAPVAHSAPVAQLVEDRGASGWEASSGTEPVVDASPAPSTPAVESPATWTLTVPAWLQGFDRPLAALWIAASLLWGAILVGSALRIHRSRGRWRETMLDGMPVYMSHDVGPALFGLTRFGIVVPTWVAGLDPERRRLILAHEREHARAADPVTLLVGALLVLIQPLNPAVWAMFRRLRLAIEIDCDARVLTQTGDVRTYGELLIDVGERTLTGAAPIAALSESGSQLERRIDAMSRRRAQRASLRAAGALGASAVIGIAAWKLPLLAAADAQQRPATVSVDTSRGPRPERAIVRINSVGIENAGPRPTILVWGEGGPVWFATGTEPLRLLVDTVRLDRLPAMRFDVTDGHAFVALEGQGALRLGGEVEGGAARSLSGYGRRIVFRRGGRGVANAIPTLDGMQLTAAQQASVDRIRQRYRSLFDKLNGYDPSITPESRPWMGLALLDKQQAEIRTVLTEEQRVVFDRRAAETKAANEFHVRWWEADQRRRNSQPVTATTDPRVARAQDSARAAAARGSPLFVGMQLTAAQQASIDRIRQRYAVLQDAINRDTASVEVRTSMFNASRVRQRAEMRAVLTEEQQVVFDKRAAEQKAHDEELVRQALEMTRRNRQP